MYRTSLRRAFPLLASIAIIVAAFLAFGHALVQDFSPIDDTYLIMQNLAIRGPTFAHLKTIFTTFDPELYIPLTFLSFQIDYLIGGLHPWIFHLTNILLHAANGVLVYFLVRKCTKGDLIALFCGLLFSVHPLQTESVVWAMIRKDLLSTFFLLLTVLLYFSGRRNRLAYGAGIATFLLALLSKVTVAPLPFVLLFHDFFVEKRRDRGMILDKIPHFTIAIAFVVIAFLGKTHVMGAIDPLTMIVLSGKSIALTLQHFVFPHHLVPFYEEAGKTLFSIGNIFALSVALLFCVMTVLLLFKTPRFGFGLFFFLVMLSPSFLSPFRAGALYGTADHYAYLPIIGLILSLGILLSVIGKKIPSFMRPAPLALGAILIAILCLLSVRQAKVWDSAATLFKYALETKPSSVAARTAYAKVQLDTNDPLAAFETLKQGLKYGDDPRLHLTAGMIYARSGQIPEAEEQFRKAFSMDPTNPEPLFSLGSVEEQTQRPDDALAHYQRALALDPSYVAAALGIGRIKILKNDFAGAEREFRTVLAWNWNTADAHIGLARALVKQGKADEAEMHRIISNEIRFIPQ
ncbi:MAG: tetratricopeptide repeat protein [Candidatus Peribacteraceae bacterium]|nr:tetratricopeptide repeat protein [Candidatus Peribacteraceae bacterium]MDD5074458.1 tetratricopeptide repeat protein [Candidatus Peribacteraceae bacterium]